MILKMGSIPRAILETFHLIDFTSGSQTRLTFDPGAESSHTWKPDGSFIAFHTTRDGPEVLGASAQWAKDLERP